MKRPAPGRSEPAPLRIAYLFQQFPLATETFAVSDIAALLEQGHQVTVYTVKRRRRDEDALLEMLGVPEQVRIMRPTWSGARTWPAALFRQASCAAMLAREILRNAPSAPVTALQALLCIPRILEIADDVKRADHDVVHAFWARHVGLVLPAMRERKLRALRSAFVGAYDLVADDFLVRMTLDSARVIFSHAEVNRDYVKGRAPQSAEIEIVRRGIPLQTLADETVRAPFSWITASSLIRPKNVEGVIRAFAKARAAEPRLSLQIFGQGPDRQRSEGIARELGCSDAVRFEGHVSRGQLFMRMQRASLFLLLSKGKWERLPNVVKEALWAGCAALSSNSEGIDELIPDRSIGHVVDPDDPAALDEAIRAILAETEDQAEERRRRARLHVAEHFSSEASMRSYVAAWRSCGA
jgi:glycosyltransferase involved in cell wall biosynthesis